MNSYNKKGSAILMVLIVMSIAIIIGLGVFKSMMRMHHLVLEHVHVVQHRILTQSIVQYGIDLVKSDYIQWCAEEKKQEMTFAISDLIGTLHVCGTGNEITIDAHLERDSRRICFAGCRLVKNENQKLAIESFQR